MIQITRGQLKFRSLYELLITAIYHEFQGRCKNYNNMLMHERESLKCVQAHLCDLYRAYNVLIKKEVEIDDALDGLNKLSLSFDIHDKLSYVIKTLNYKEVIHIPQEYRDNIFLEYFTDKVTIEFY